jgi:hypothetical protein
MTVLTLMVLAAHVTNDPPAPALTALRAGRYRLEVQVVVEASVPVLSAQRTITRTTSVVDIDDAGVAVARACRVETSGPGFTSRMPPVSLRGLPTSRFTIEQRDDELVADMGEGTVGFVGAGPLPTSPTDPRVTDPDGDGVPGVRMNLDLGAMGQWTLQVVSRGRTAFAGRATPSGAAGRLTLVTSEEQVLSGLPVQLPARASTIDPSRSSFSLTRVDRDDELRCAW